MFIRLPPKAYCSGPSQDQVGQNVKNVRPLIFVMICFEKMTLGDVTKGIDASAWRVLSSFEDWDSVSALVLKRGSWDKGLLLAVT